MIIKVCIGIIALLHLYFMWFEMFAWTSRGKKLFGKSLPQELFEKTKPMAANQGLYNGFLAAGLIWSLLIQDPSWYFNTALFFLGCVFIAGVYGAYSVHRKIFYIQGFPSAITITLLYLPQ